MSRRGQPVAESRRRTTPVSTDVAAPIFFISSHKGTSEKIVEVLKKRGIDCIAFLNAFDALSHEKLNRARAIIMDLRYPTSDDISIYKILRSGEAAENIPFVFLVGQDAKLSARASGISTMDQFLTMPVSASVLCDTIHQVLVRHKRRTRIIKVSGNRVMRGELKEITLPELVQFLQMGRKTGFLHARSQRAKGLIAFVNGEIHHAEVGPIEGDEAFYLLMSLTDGVFEFESDVRPANRTIEQNITNLLLEGMRQLDEVKSLLEQFSQKAVEVENAKNRQRFGDDDSGIIDPT